MKTFLALGVMSTLTAGAVFVNQSQEPIPPIVNEVALRGIKLPGDTVRVIAVWAASSDILGAADSYIVKWTTNSGFLLTKTTSVLRDTTLIPIDAILPDSTRVNVLVTPVRRGISGPARGASRWFKRADVAPPPIDSVRIDTVASFITLLAEPLMDLGQTTPVCILATTTQNNYLLMLGSDNPADTLPGVFVNPLTEPMYAPCVTAIQNRFGITITPNMAIYNLGVAPEPNDQFARSWRKAN